MAGKYNTTFDDIRRLNKIIYDCVDHAKNKETYGHEEFKYLISETVKLCDQYKDVMDKIVQDNNIGFININLLEVYFSEFNQKYRSFLHSGSLEKQIIYLRDIINVFNKILTILWGFEEDIKNSKLDEKIIQLDKRIYDVSQLTEKVKNINTHEIYDLAVKKHRDRAYEYRVVFLVLIFLVIVIVWFSAVFKSFLGLEKYDYWFFKVTLTITSITLITFYLKLSTKYQNLADQCEQTKLELEAFPTFVASFSTEDPQIIEIRKELALKYFGRDLVNNDKAEASNIITDQMKNTTELVKATTEAIKNLNTKTGGTSGS